MNHNKQYYFMCDDKIIQTGTILKMKSRSSKYNGEYSIEEITFEWYVPESDLYVLRYRNSSNSRGVGMHGDEFRRYFICPTNKIDERVVRDYNMMMESNKLTLIKELQIDGMFIAWLWYIVLMAITFVFNGFYLYWAFISLCFFIYRNGKLKEEGYK